MSSPRPRRAMAAAVLGLSLIAPLLAAPGAGAALGPGAGVTTTSTRPGPTAPPAAPPIAASLDAERLAVLKALRAERPATLRGVLAGIAASVNASSGTGGIGGADLAGLVTRKSAAGTTLVAVTIRTDSPFVLALMDRLERLGAEIANRSDTAVEAYLSPAVLELVAGLPGVEAVEPVLPAIVQGVVGAGVGIHGASTWQAAGYLGAGIKVGIIDGGFTGMRALLGEELPASVHARCYSGVGSFSSNLSVCEAEGIDHGTAVAETIVDMAPNVVLYVANPLSLQDYQRTVTWMTSNGVKVINASLATAYQGPGDGSDPTGASLYTVITQATKAGALWVNSAGNSGQSGWFGPWSDPDADDFLNFPGGDQENTLELSAGQQVIVTARWNEPWGKSKNDYDIGVFDDSTALIASSVDVQNGNDDPVETLVFQAPFTGAYHIVATRHLGATVSRFQLLVLSSGESPLEHRVLADTIPSPVDSRAAALLTVGAVDVTAPDTIETYSSRGPTLDNRVKPDLVAGDCGTTVSLGTFCGTSQSAPHVAGAAALVFEGFPKFTAPQVAAYLRSRAQPLGGSSPNNIFGAGRLDLGAAPGVPVPTGLAFQAQPGGAIEGSLLSTQPVVRVIDADGATVAIGSGATLGVTIALGANPSGAVLSCDTGLTVAAAGGIATFDGCRVDRVGQGYALVATATALPPATSTAFTITGPPIELVFATQPDDGVAGQALPSQPVVQVTDGAGKVYASGPSSTLSVTLAIEANAGAASLTCTGGNTVNAIAGVATFSGCAVSAPGTGTTFVATGGAATPGTSAPFDVKDPDGVLVLPTLTVATSATAIRWGDGVRLEARIGVPADTVPAADRSVQFQSTSDGTTWKDVGDPLTTDAEGVAGLTYRPVTNLYYRAVLAPGSDLAAGTSPSARVTVRQLIALKPSISADVRVVARRTRIEFQTVVRPSRAEVPAGDVTLRLYRLVNSRWTLVSTQVATPNSAGVASIYVTFSTSGRFYVRRQANPTPLNANSGWSPIERYDVR